MTSGAGSSQDGTVSLAQIVAALSVTYSDEGVTIWLRAPNHWLGGSSPTVLIARGRIAEVADAVRRIGDADPSDFTIIDAGSVAEQVQP